MRNGWDIVDSNLEKTGNEIEFNRKWTITFPVLKSISCMRVFVQNFRLIGWEMTEI